MLCTLIVNCAVLTGHSHKRKGKNGILMHYLAYSSVLIDMNGQERHSALGNLFKNEQKRMTAFADRFFLGVDEISGEDIVQDVFTHLFDMPDFSIPVEALSAYVYRSIRNKITDFFRKRRMPTVSTGEDIDIVSLMEDERSRIEELFFLDIEINLLYQALGKLDTLEQKVVIETEFEGRPFRDISEETGTPIGTLLSKKSRALKKVTKNISTGVRL